MFTSKFYLIREICTLVISLINVFVLSVVFVFNNLLKKIIMILKDLCGILTKYYTCLALFKIFFLIMRNYTLFVIIVITSYFYFKYFFYLHIFYFYFLNIDCNIFVWHIFLFIKSKSTNMFLQNFKS